MEDLNTEDGKCRQEAQLLLKTARRICAIRNGVAPDSLKTRSSPHVLPYAELGRCRSNRVGISRSVQKNLESWGPVSLGWKSG